MSSRRPIRGVKAWISYAVGFGGKLGHAPAAPTKPGMVMLGTADGIIPPARSLAVYAGMHSPKYLVKIGGAGHLVFSDICLIGRSKGGVIGIAKAIKLPIPPSLYKLGSDGCTTRRIRRSRRPSRRSISSASPSSVTCSASIPSRWGSTQTRSPASARPSPCNTDSKAQIRRPGRARKDSRAIEGRRSQPHKHGYFWSMRATGWPAIATGKPSRRASPKAITLPSAVAIQ